jgi:hypothetical protein
MTTAHAFDREIVMAYVDGETSIADTAAVRAHLDACADCRELQDEWRDVSTQLARWQAGSAPARLASAPAVPAAPVRSPFGAVATWLRRLMAWPRWVAVVAPAAIVLVTLLYGRSVLQAPDVKVTRGLEGVTRGGGDAALDPARARALSTRPPLDKLGVVVEEVPLAFAQPQGRGAAALQTPSLPATPMIARVVTLRLATDAFDTMRAKVEQLASAHSGRIASLSIGGDPKRRSLSATLRVPAAKLDALVTSLRALGKMLEESVGTEDVTSAYMDLGIRIANARKAESRLVELLARRTDKLADVLAVEQELARVRTEIERMEASLRASKDTVDLSTINLQIDENYRADVALGPLPLGERFRNAAVDGVRMAMSGVVDIALDIVQLAPSLLIWVLVLFWPVLWTVQRVRRAVAS